MYLFNSFLFSFHLDMNIDIEVDARRPSTAH